MRVAVYSFGSCEGCRYAIVNELGIVLRAFRELGLELVREPLLGLGGEPPEYEIAVIEGALTSEEDVNRVREIRRKCRYLVALGSCAALGGIVAFTYARRDGRSGASGKYVLGKPLHSSVSVDAVVKGCPVRVSEFLSVIELITKGLPVERVERRFRYVKAHERVVDDGLLRLDTGKCVACGRCVEVCSALGLSVLDYGFRGSSIVVTTPFFKSFREVGCIHCCLCAGYCPVAAITYRDDVPKAVELVRSGDVRILIDWWALRGLAKALGVDAGKVLTSLELAGAKEVRLWDPLENAVAHAGPAIVPMSSAELEYVRRFYPELSEYVKEPPEPEADEATLLVSSCAARKRGRELVLTAQEALKLLESLVGREQVANVEARALPARASTAHKGLKVLRGPDGVRRGLEGFKREPRGVLVLQLCFGGCDYGSGQPYRVLDEVAYTLPQPQ